MHYLVEVGFPSHLVKDAGIGLDSRKSDYNEVMMRIEGEVRTIMEKYNEALDETMMGEYGITPHYSDDDEGHHLYNPEGLWDWFSIGGRWKDNKIPDKGPYLSEKFDTALPYNSLHDSKLHEGCQIPCFIMFMKEPCDMQSIDMIEIITDEHLGTENFKDFRAKWDETGKYEDYIWTSVDIHN